MTNSEIAKLFETTSKLLILHEADNLVIKTYENAYQTFRRRSLNLEELSIEKIASIGNVGMEIAKEIKEILDSGSFSRYNTLQNKTPIGIQELLHMKGLGPKSLKKIWDQLDIVNAEGLLFACRQNKLKTLKGFGEKSQNRVKDQLLFFLSMRGYHLLATAVRIANELILKLEKLYPSHSFTLTGAIRRKEQILKRIDIIHTVPDIDSSKITSQTDGVQIYKNIPVVFHYSAKTTFGTQLLLTTGPEQFLNTLATKEKEFAEEQSIFKAFNIHFIPPEIRHHKNIVAKAKNDDFSSLITVSDIKGSLHMHTTDSDGIHSLEEMVAYADSFGYEYMLISDHSKSAGYANGLQIERLLSQVYRIQELNKKYKIKIYSGIESDILADGSLDYPDDILAQLDVVVASVHSGLRMDIHKATDRIIKAIQNPHTKIMGHLTGRLLLSREAYPVDHKKILDVCAVENTVMELNANPLRLDIDEQHIKYAMEQGVKISINPDAHATHQLSMMQWGVNAARRGGLTKQFCLNALSAADFDKWVNGDKS